MNLFLFIAVVFSLTCGVDYYVKGSSPADEVVESNVNCSSESQPCVSFKNAYALAFSNGDVIHLINDYPNFSTNSSACFETIISFGGNGSNKITVTDGNFVSSVQLRIYDLQFVLPSTLSTSLPFLNCQGSLLLINIKFENSPIVSLTSILIYVYQPKRVFLENSSFAGFNHTSNYSFIYIGDKLDIIGSACSSASVLSSKEYQMSNQVTNFINISNSIFTNIETTGSGAAFQIKETNPSVAVPVYINNCKFSNLKANLSGGAINLVLPTLFYLHFPSEGLCTFSGISTEKKYDLRFINDVGYPDNDVCYTNSSTPIGVGTHIVVVDGENISVTHDCQKRGVVLLVEVLEDVVFPFDKTLYDLEGLIQASNKSGFSRQESHIYFHDIFKTMEYDGIVYYYSDTRRIYHSLERLFPEVENYPEEADVQNLPWSYYTGVSAQNQGNCVTASASCLQLHVAVNGAESQTAIADGSVVFVGDNTILSGYCELNYFIEIIGYQCSGAPDYIRTVTVDGPGKIYVGGVGTGYIKHVRFNLQKFNEDFDENYESNGFITSRSFLYLYHVQLVAGYEQPVVIHSYQSLLQITAGKAKFEDLLVTNIQIQVFEASVIWISLPDKPRSDEIIRTDYDIDIKQLTMKNCTSSGPGAALFALLGQDILISLTQSTFENCVLDPKYNVECCGAPDENGKYDSLCYQASGACDPIDIEGWFGNNHLEIGGAAFQIMASSLLNVYIPESGPGFSFKNNSIMSDTKVMGYGADVVIYITDQNTVAVPTGASFPNLVGLYNEQLYTPSTQQGPKVNGSSTIIGFGDPMERGLYTRNQYSLEEVLGPIPESKKACNTLIPDDVIAAYKAAEYKSQFAAACVSRPGCALIENTPSGGASYSCGKPSAPAAKNDNKKNTTVVIVVVVVVAVVVVIVVLAITVIVVVHIRTKGYKKYEENGGGQGSAINTSSSSSKTSPTDVEVEVDQ